MDGIGFDRNIYTSRNHGKVSNSITDMGQIHECVLSFRVVGQIPETSAIINVQNKNAVIGHKLESIFDSDSK